jgi:hypothetical protein
LLFANLKAVKHQQIKKATTSVPKIRSLYSSTIK